MTTRHTLDLAMRELEEKSSGYAREWRPSQVFEAAKLTLIPTFADVSGFSLDDEASSQRSNAPEFEQIGRYEILGELGRGGMGRVLEAYDPELKRLVAVKILLSASTARDVKLQRFISEAQITSQLQHPAIMPVYDLGITEDGVLYYVMKRVTGRSLHEVLTALERGDEETRSAWSLHRLLQAFVRVCEAVAYAHACGVLHRDLKPDNIMLGAFGEVLVMDWGVARLVGDSTEVLSRREIERVDMAHTEDGALIGTLNYMSPEQLRGEIHELDGRSDVWSLGAILYEILTLQRAYESRRFFDTDMRAPADPRTVSPKRSIDEDIAATCLKAMAPSKDARFQGAEALAKAVQDFIEGRRRRERALAIMNDGLPLESEASALSERASALKQDAREALRDVPKYAPVDEKRAAWRKEDEAERLETDAEDKLLTFRYAMQTALTYAPDLAAPHVHLAANYRRLHERAEAAGEARLAQRYETLLRLHDRGRHASYLEGKGALTLLSDPDGAQVTLYRYELRERRLHARQIGVLGHTPLRAVELERGRYLLELRAEGHETVRYPVWIRRNAHWDGVPPEAREPCAIELPRAGRLAEGSCYVPAGWFIAGGDPLAPGAFPEGRYWLDAFVIQRFPVTNAEYIRFLDDLVDTGREEEALRCVPREHATGQHKGLLTGDMIMARDEAGHFLLKEDADGDLWLPDQAVTMITWFNAIAYARWLRARDGKPWRLPFELEWEKAARGVDGRRYPWGDAFDPSWANTYYSNPRPIHEVIDTYPEDESPYGVRGLAGNVVDWCADVFSATPPDEGRLVFPDAPPPDPEDGEPTRITRGGSWGFGESGCRLAWRGPMMPQRTSVVGGFRLVRPYRSTS